MFAKMKTAKYLKAQAGADAAEVAFVPGVQKLARVHHYSLRDRVSRRGPMVKYAERQLLGVNDDVETSIRDALLRWLTD
jgi:phage virion morphogenesis protein